MSAPPGVFVHEKGICESAQIGGGTRIWAFAHVLPGAKIGRDCSVCDGVFIENDVVVGDRVTIKPGVQLWDGVTLGNEVFVGPNATFTNDLHPRSRQPPAKFLRTVVRDGASIGANATILPGIRIGERAMIGAGAVVIHDVPARAVVVGNPGRIVGYTDTASRDRGKRDVPDTQARTEDLNVTGCRLLTLPTFGDLRGKVTVAEFGGTLPFAPARVFYVHTVPSDQVRGEHAHRKCLQVIAAVNGRVTIILDDGANREEILLDDPGLGLFIPRMVWAEQYKFSRDCVLMVFASEPYDASDYIREYGEFLELTNRKRLAPA